MARKVNPMLAGIEARHREQLRAQRLFTIQQCADMLLIAANAAFGFGADRLNKLEEIMGPNFRPWEQRYGY